MYVMLINNECFRNYMKTLVDLFWKFLVTIREFLGEFFITKPVAEFRLIAADLSLVKMPINRH